MPSAENTSFKEVLLELSFSLTKWTSSSSFTQKSLSIGSKFFFEFSERLCFFDLDELFCLTASVVHSSHSKISSIRYFFESVDLANPAVFAILSDVLSDFVSSCSNFLSFFLKAGVFKKVKILDSSKLSVASSALTLSAH